MEIAIYLKIDMQANWDGKYFTQIGLFLLCTPWIKSI